MAETLTPTREHAAKHYEIVHYPNIDAVVNNDSPLARLAPAIAEVYKDGLEQVPEGWEQTGQHIWMAHGNIDGVELFTKPKAFSGDTFYQQKEVMLEKAQKYHYTKEMLQGATRSRQLLNSVLNEIVISPIVRDLVDSPQGQALARNRGFKSFKFVEPIVGLIDKSTEKRALVYPYVINTGSLAFYKTKERLGITSSQGHVDFFSPIENLFHDNGIDPGDFADRQFLTDDEGTLYLIDIEMYSRMSEREIAEEAEAKRRYPPNPNRYDN